VKAEDNAVDANHVFQERSAATKIIRALDGDGKASEMGSEIDVNHKIRVGAYKYEDERLAASVDGGKLPARVCCSTGFCM
jgi:hypothetical protein